MEKQENKVNGIINSISEMKKNVIKDEQLKELKNFSRIKQIISGYRKIEDKVYILLSGNDKDCPTFISIDDLDKDKKILRISTISALFQSNNFITINNMLEQEQEKESSSNEDEKEDQQRKEEENEINKIKEDD